MRALLVSVFLVLAVSATAEQPVSLPQGASEHWWSDVQRSIRASEYEPTLHGGTLSAPNRAQNFRTTFAAAGVVVVPKKEAQAWRWEIGLAGVAPVQPHANGSRVEYERGELTEWYVNGKSGLEQGFTLTRPVAPYVQEDVLRVPLRLGGTLRPRQRGDAIDFVTADGALAIRYDHLSVVDASGRRLDAWMELRGSGSLDLVALVRAAAWPVVVDPLATSPNWTAEGDQESARFGYSVAPAGDVNGDGYADVIVGANAYMNGSSGTGRAFVYHGSASGLSATAAWTAESDQGNASFGDSVASAGDVNGDGYADVIVGASYYDNHFPNEGRATVYYGSASGLSATAAWTADGGQIGAFFGWSVASAGDVNGDGYADVIVGAPFYDNGSTDEGRSFVFHGSATGLSGTAAWTAESDQEGASFGWSVASAGDVNGDGYADVIAGAHEYDNGSTDEGRAFVYHGSASGLSATAIWTAESDQAGGGLGFSVASAGDVNGDGYADVVVGAMTYDGISYDTGRALVYHGSGSGLSATPAWTAESGQMGARFGSSVASAGDVNGDGYADVIVGAYEYDNDHTEEGRAFLYHGSATGLSATAAWTAESDQADAWLGWSVASAGDVNGDGYADVIVGAYQYDNGQSDEGRAFVYHGSASGLAATAGWTAESDQTSALFGCAVASAGDVNGDGYADVIVGAQFYDNGEANEGRAFVYHGSASGLSATAAWTAESDQADANFGYSVASAGDVNGDGYADVIVGAFFYDAGSTDEGRAFVYHGSVTGLSSTAAWTAEGDQTSAWFGTSVAPAGDVNGDGYADVIVGADYYDAGSANEGQVFVFHGSAAGLSATAVWTAEGNQDNAYFGRSVASAGDVNGDGYADVIVGAPYYNAGSYAEGRTFVYHGSAAGLSAVAAWTAESNQMSAFFGRSVASAGDVNGDGYADVIVGAYSYDGGSTDEGRAFVYHGSPSGLSATAAWTAESDQASARFGWSVASAGDVNGDGYADVIVGADLYDAPSMDEGRAFVYHGSATGLSATAAWTANSDQSIAWFGVSVASAGDVNGDGYADVIVGAYGYTNGSSDEGRTYVYYGNASRGRSLATQQLRGDGSRPAQEWGASHDGTSFIVAVNANSPRGRQRARVQAEACPPGSAFGAPGCTTVTSASWTDLGADGTARIQLPVTGLAPETLYHWRARALFAPASVTMPGVTAPPAPEHTPWRRLDAQGDNSDIRIAVPQTVTIGLVSAASSVAEAGTYAGVQVVVTTSDGLPTVAASSVSYTTADGTAIAPGDYYYFASTLSVHPETASGTILTLDVPVMPDTVDENNETFTFTISAPNGASLGPITTTTVTILDDDAPPAFAVNDISLAEGNAGTTAFTFTITKTGSTDLTATVDVATADGTATVADGDYGAVAPNTLSFAPAEGSKTVTVNVTGDAKFESNETFLVNLTNATNASTSDSQGVGTITNDDAAPAVTLSLTGSPIAEASGVATVTATLSAVSGQAATVNLAFSGTAASPSDYTRSDTAIVVAAGSLSSSITLTAVQDTTDETGETIVVGVESVIGGTESGTQQVTVTITDDDAPASFSISDVALAEGNSGTTSFTFWVTKSGTTAFTTSVVAATADGTATTAGGDYTALQATTLTFTPAETAKSVTVSVGGDATFEAAETFVVNLSDATNATIGDGQGSGTITNDDAAPALVINDVTQAEGNSGTTSFVFTVTLSGATERTATVDFATANGTATAGSDYTLVSGTRTFAPGTTTQTITVSATGDTTCESHETFTVNLSGATNATIMDVAGTGTIQNDDALPTLSINSVSQAEGNGGTSNFVFTVTLTGATEQIVTVAYATSNGTATAGSDYTATSGTRTFTPDDTTETITVGVAGETAVENDETFSVTLSAPVNAAIVTGIGTGTIVNDDASPFGAPQLFSATTLSASTIRLSWAPVSGATGYEIHRTTSVPAGYSLLTTTTGTSYDNSGLTANTAYLYKVRAMSGAAASAFSEVDGATTTVFTDVTLSSAITVKAVHVTQLRSAVNAMRAAAGLAAAPFSTDPVLTPGSTPIKGAHITELRTALDQARDAIGLPDLNYTDGALIGGLTPIKAVHVTELRSGTQ